MIRFVFRLVFQFIFWVFVLSIRIDGKTLFEQASDYIVKNEVIDFISENVVKLWQNLVDLVSKDQKNII